MMPALQTIDDNYTTEILKGILGKQCHVLGCGVHQVLLPGFTRECCTSLPLCLIAACSSLLFVLLPIILFYFLGKCELVNYPNDCLV